MMSSLGVIPFMSRLKNKHRSSTKSPPNGEPSVLLLAAIVEEPGFKRFFYVHGRNRSFKPKKLTAEMLSHNLGVVVDFFGPKIPLGWGWGPCLDATRLTSKILKQILINMILAKIILKLGGKLLITTFSRSS